MHMPTQLTVMIDMRSCIDQGALSYLHVSLDDTSGHDLCAAPHNHAFRKYGTGMNQGREAVTQSNESLVQMVARGLAGQTSDSIGKFYRVSCVA